MSMPYSHHSELEIKLVTMIEKGKHSVVHVRNTWYTDARGAAKKKTDRLPPIKPRILRTCAPSTLKMSMTMITVTIKPTAKVIWNE